MVELRVAGVSAFEFAMYSRRSVMSPVTAPMVFTGAGPAVDTAGSDKFGAQLEDDVNPSWVEAALVLGGALLTALLAQVVLSRPGPPPVRRDLFHLAVEPGALRASDPHHTGTRRARRPHRRPRPHRPGRRTGRARGGRPPHLPGDGAHVFEPLDPSNPVPPL